MTIVMGIVTFMLGFPLLAAIRKKLLNVIQRAYVINMQGHPPLTWYWYCRYACICVMNSVCMNVSCNAFRLDVCVIMYDIVFFSRCYQANLQVNAIEIVIRWAVPVSWKLSHISSAVAMLWLVSAQREPFTNTYVRKRSEVRSEMKWSEMWSARRSEQLISVLQNHSNCWSVNQ